ncbi:MAG TPA: amidase family protein, partial [Burkholderiales bacterium]|nr:amidase family protein [Burkholderiales bacterium]
RPASFCGVFGYRPSYGDLRTGGVMESSGSLDTLGILARSVEDVALYRDVLLGIEPEPLPEDIASPRIGFCRPYFWDRLEPATQALLEQAARRLARAGAKLAEVTLAAADYAVLEEAHRWISGFEMARNLAWEIAHHWERISEGLREGRLKDGLACSYQRYCEMRERVEHCRTLVAPVLARYDALLAPAAVGEAPPGTHPVPHPYVYMIWTTMHVPSIALPVFRGPNGLPVGAQLVGRRSQDRRLLAVARWAYRVLRQD